MASAVVCMHHLSTSLLHDRTAWCRAVKPLLSFSNRVTWRVSGNEVIPWFAILSKFKMRASNSSFPNLKQYEPLEKQISLTIIDDECGVSLHMSIIVVVLVTGSFLWSNVFRSLRRWLRPSFGLCSVQICSSLSKIASAITNCWNISAVWSASVPCVRRNFEALSTFCREIL